MNVHICFITDEFPPYRQGGIGVFTKTIAIALTQKGYKVSVIGHYQKKYVRDYTEDGINFYLLKKSKIPKFNFLLNRYSINKKLKTIDLKHKIDVIEAPNISMAFVSNKIKALRIMRIHSEISTTRGYFRKWLINKTLNNTDKIIAVSEFSKTINCKNLHIPTKDITVIYNPIDTELFYPRKSKVTPNSIIFVGRISENKGILQLFEAMEYVVKVIPDVKLTIVGNDTIVKGKSFKETAFTNISEKTKKAIDCIGLVANEKIPILISTHQIAVYPSHQENMPIAWLEGMAMGKAIVCSDIKPAHEIAKHGETALLSDPFNPEEIAKNIIKLLKNNELSITLGKNAAKMVEVNFSIKVLIKQNINLYKKH